MSGSDNTSYTVRTQTGGVQQQSVHPSDSVIIWLSGGFAIYTLPPAAEFPGRVIEFIQHNDGAGSIQVFAPEGDTADGEAHTVSWDAGGNPKGRLGLVSDGVNGWWSIYSVSVSRI